MADSLCGPSNALQNFQKHSTADRTLQQDRLISRPSPANGFRSSPGPNVGLLDREFETFQNSQSVLGGQPSHPQFSNPSSPFHPQLSHPPTPQSLNQPGYAEWVSDFRGLQLATPSPSPLAQSSLQNPAQQNVDGGWQQGFMQQYKNGQQSGSMQSGYMGGQPLASRFSPMPGGVGIGIGMQYGGGTIGQAQQVQQPAETFDDAAFAHEFEEFARAELAAEEESTRLLKEVEIINAESIQEQMVKNGEEILLEESAERLMASDQEQIPPQNSDQLHGPIEPRIGADLIEDHKLQPKAEDPDYMAQTAAHLLSAVRNNTSDKFNNSEFFQLMRGLRDKEVKVTENNFVPLNRKVTEGGEQVNTQA